MSVSSPDGFMLEALRLAKEAGAEGEVPVGAVVVRRGVIVGRGRNRRELGKSALAHAELEAISDACRTLGGWRLWECELYVTLEPCPMCAGAIINSRIPVIYYGAKDPKAGCCGSVTDLFALPFNHKPQVISGLRGSEASALLSDFFLSLRIKTKKRRLFTMQKFYICKHCGNLIGLIQDAGVSMVCCGENMTQLHANTTDASQEKHVPVVTVKDDTVTVNVGSVLHPMVEEHHIEWVYLQTELGGQRKALLHTGDPNMTFKVVDDTPQAVFAYCNLHGLWKTEL